MQEFDIIYPREPKKEMRVLTSAEQSRLTSYLVKDMDKGKFGILLALLTGMRVGEVYALRWEDISLEDNIIHVKSTIQRLQTLP